MPRFGISCLSQGEGDKIERICMEKSIPSLTIIFFVLNLAIIFAIVLIKDFLPPVVPLFYGLPTGEEQLVASMFLTLPAIIASLITIINTVLIKLIPDDFLHKILLGIIITSFSLSTITIVKIVTLVGSF